MSHQPLQNSVDLFRGHRQNTRCHLPNKLRNLCLHRPSRCLGKMWLDLPFAQVSWCVEQNVQTSFSFPNPHPESEELQSSRGRVKILISFLMRFDGHFWPNQRQQQYLSQFKSIVDGHHSHLLLAPFRLEIDNATEKRLIGSEPHSHKPLHQY